MGPLIALVLVAQCGYSAGYTTSYACTAPAYYNTAVTYVPYVQAVKFVAVEPSYCDLYPSLVAGELRAARRYEAAERQAAAIERLETALERMATPAPASVQASYRYQAAYVPPPAPSGQDVTVSSQEYSAPQVPAKVAPSSYSAPQVPAKAPPPSYSAPQVPAKAPPSYSAPQVPAKAPPSYSAPQVPAKAPPPSYSAPQVPAKAPPPSYSAPQVPAKANTDYGDVAPPAGPALPEPSLGGGSDGLAVLGMRCAPCHTQGATRGNKFAMFEASGRLSRSLTSEQATKMVARVEAGDMPPTGPLAGDEVAAIRRYLAAAPTAMARQ